MSEGLSNGEVVDLHLRYGFFIRRRCLAILRNPALVDDAFQEVFVKLMRAGSGVRVADEPLRWLYRVTDRACFDQLRRTKLARRDAPLDEFEDVLPAHPGIEPELRRAAVELLERLDDEDQQIAVMAFVDGMSQQEIADELGYARMTIVSRMARLRERAQRVSAERARPRSDGVS